MLVTLQCVCLRTVPYSDTRAILDVLTRTHGRVSLYVSLSSGQGARRIRALTQPMSLVEAVVDLRAGRQVQSMREVTPQPGRASMALLSMHPAKVAQLPFLAEATARLSQEAFGDTALYDYAAASVDALGAMRGQQGIANFALRYLLGMARVLGIAPDPAGWHGTEWLDMRTGRLRPTPPQHAQRLSPSQCRLWLAVAIVPLRHLGAIRLDRGERRQMLDLVLQYYALHLRAVAPLITLDVMRGM